VLAVVKPSPLRLWGFLLTVVGGALIGFGAVSTWAAVSLGGSTVGAIPTRGIDVWQGKLTLLLGAAIVIGIMALRFVLPEHRRIVAIAILVFAGLALLTGLWCVVAIDSAIRAIGVTHLVNVLVDAGGMTVSQAQALVAQGLTRFGIDVKPQIGLWLVVAGGALAVAGGILDLAWVRRKREAGDTIDPDTFSEDAHREAAPTADAT
jgi:hypothetical protein